jgi:methyl-accepting chemotaxis protein
MDGTTQQNAALVEEAAAAADSLNRQADLLVSLVGRFRLDGADAAPTRPAIRQTAAPKALAAA